MGGGFARGRRFPFAAFPRAGAFDFVRVISLPAHLAVRTAADVISMGAASAENEKTAHSRNFRPKSLSYIFGG
jgi:hypothetical protein